MFELSKNDEELPKVSERNLSDEFSLELNDKATVKPQVNNLDLPE